MATGTGWPFGGPNVPLSQAACKAIFQEYPLANIGKAKVLDISCTDTKQKQAPTLSRVMLFSPDHETDDITELARRTKDGKGYELPLKDLRIAAHDKIIVLYVGRTQQMVKRAAPGGEGFVIDHFDKEAVRSYLATFETAFNSSRTPRPHTFFNDSYEVYGADWTPSLLEEFNKRRGYCLEDVFDLFLMPDAERTDQAIRVLSDYRETMGELLLENFTTQWTE
ncbi:MAG: glycosyl hydrolase family 2, partial [Bacteroidaceae bacterium]|nr:glycosyl hydrolase family 2 [Bacteroidaceae bacterium]